MYKQIIDIQENAGICDNCKEWNEQRIKIVRLDLLNKNRGAIIGPDLFHKIWCKKCLIDTIEKELNELNN